MTSAMVSHLREEAARGCGGKHVLWENLHGTGYGSLVVDFKIRENPTNNFILSLACVFYFEISNLQKRSV